MDLRGNVYVPTDGRSSATISASVKHAGMAWPIVSLNYSAGFNDDILESVDVNPVVWAPCAKRSTVKIDTVLLAVKPPRSTASDDVQVAVDSTDVALNTPASPGVHYTIVTKACT